MRVYEGGAARAPPADVTSHQTSFFSSSAFLASNSSCVRMPLALSSPNFSSVAMTSSGFTVAAAAAAAAGATAPAGVKAEDVMSTLERLGEMKTKGILTQEEFDAKKAELLKKLV